MKTKNLLLLPLLGLMALTGCNKTEPVATETTPGTPIDVTMSIAGVNSLSRTVGDSDATKPNVNNGRVFFLSSDGNVLETHVLDNETITTADGQIFAGVNANATNVYVVANHTDIDDIDSQLAAATTLSEIKAITMSVGTQQTSNLDVVLANTIDAANFAAYDATIKLNNETSKYEAYVLLGIPLSRIQLADIKTEDDRIISFNLAGVHIDNYYKEFAAEVGASGSGGVFTVGIDASALTSDNALSDVYGTAITDGGDKTITASDANGDVTNAVWGYQTSATTAPSDADATDVPAIIIHLKNVVYTDANGDEVTMADAYITVTSYMDATGVITNFEPGKVYDIASNNFVFDLSNLDTIPNAEELDLCVMVDVKEWESVDITPVL